MLFQPIHEMLNTENIIIVTDGLLGYLPFEALLTEEVQPENLNYSNLPYLIQSYNISYCYSGTLLKELVERKSDASSKSFLAFAPVFKSKSNIGYNSITSKHLPMTKDEVEKIGNLFRDNNLEAEVLLFENANKNTLIEKDLTKYGYIHFATHGEVDEEKPMLSNLRFAATNFDSAVGQSLLYSDEIFSLRLNAKLVVLSACETGLGKIVRGEGIIGLTRGFLYAGASNVVVSLWKVADKSTSYLMQNFYRLLMNNVPKSEALRRSKLEMISNSNYASPFYWSPFVLIGS